MKPLLYDCFSGAGGATKGYQEAGFYVVGIDIKPQPRYVGDEFIQMDALQFLAELLEGKWPEPAVIHASPPCQAYSMMQNIHKNSHILPDLIGPVRELLQAAGKPYVIENVPGAPLINPIRLCGTMFNLRITRHRLFESNPPIWFPPSPCNHWLSTAKLGRYPDREKEFHSIVGNFPDIEYAYEAMGIDWMARDELSQAIPPAYCKFIGERLMEYLQTEVMPC